MRVLSHGDMSFDRKSPDKTGFGTFNPVTSNVDDPEIVAREPGFLRNGDDVAPSPQQRAMIGTDN